MDLLTVGSLFAGIGGFDLGLERTGGFKVRFQVEIDEYCRRVLEKHWPDVQRYGDIRTVIDVERVDVLCGGFPCQDISNAGKRVGIDGERSGLWSEYVRIIRMVRPRYVLIENVAALLNRGMERVLGDLAACGYDAEWDVISAASVGAPHRRDRVWIVAYDHQRGLRRDGESRETVTADKSASDVADASGERLPVLRAAHRAAHHRGDESPGDLTDRCGEVMADTRSGQRTGRSGHQPERTAEQRRDRSGNGCSAGDLSDSSQPGLSLSEQTSLLGTGWRQEGRAVAERDRRSTQSVLGGTPDGLPPRLDRYSVWLPGWEDDVPRIAKGIPNRVARLKGLGNAIVPQIAQWLGQRILEFERSQND